MATIQAPEELLAALGRVTKNDPPGALMIGVLIGTGPAPAPSTVRLEWLRRAPFEGPGTIIYARTHEALLHQTAQEALSSGLLDE